jgi:hypothetical protein
MPLPQGPHSRLKSDTRYHLSTKTVDQAHQLFTRAVNNLLTINKWHELTGKGVVFQLVNRDGLEIYTAPQKFDFIRIGLPGNSSSGEENHYEWVQIERIDYYKTSLMEAVVVRAKPAVPPQSQSKPLNRYFSPDSTNNFSVERLGKRVTASVHVIDENIASRSWFRNSRFKKGIGILVSFLGLKKSQWKKLVKGIVKRVDEQPAI